MPVYRKRDLLSCSIFSQTATVKIQPNQTRGFVYTSCGSEIKERLGAVYSDSSPSMATVKNWFNEFQSGRMSVFFYSHVEVPRKWLPPGHKPTRRNKMLNDVLV